MQTTTATPPPAPPATGTSGPAAPRKKLFPAIFFAGLIVGTLDISSAIVIYWINGGSNAVRIFRYIASGLFGKTALAGGTMMAIWGLLLHYFIAYSFTVVYFLLYRRIRALATHKLLSGIIYGILIWAIMNGIVVPLSQVPSSPKTFVGLFRAMVVLICMIGLPLAYLCDKWSPKE